MKGFNDVQVYVEGRGVVSSSFCVENGRFRLGKTADEPYGEIGGCVVVPGFIDEHIHGAAGSDAMDGTEEALTAISDALAREGTVAFLATTMTQSKQNILNSMNAVRNYIKKDRREGAQLLGVHLEGPFISPDYIGAQPLEYVVSPDIAAFDEYNAASGGNIRIVSMAPEREGAEAFVRHLASLGVRVSVGHSGAGYKDMVNAFAWGATGVTHTYNAQKGIHHREIGVAGSAMLIDGYTCELICDTIHVSVPAIKLVIKNKPHDKVILITDAMRAKQMPDGVSELGGQTVYVKNGEARLANGALAGSVLKMNVAIANLVKNGVPFTDAVDFASANPAKNLGIFNERGSIAEGKAADFTVLDGNFNVVMTVRGGNVIYKA